MAISRRQFIKCSGLAAAGGLIVPSLFGNRWVQRALADTIGDRFFVVIYLDGGNDGLNTFAPASNGSGTLRSDYELARALNPDQGGIQLTPTELQDTILGTDPNTGADLALHPGFGPWFAPGGVATLGKVAVIQGCGYPEYTLSHEGSRQIWQAADPFGVFSTGNTGWVGRHLASPLPIGYDGSAIPAVTIADSVSGEFRQSVTNVLSIRDVQEFRFPFEFGDSDDAAKKTAFNDLHQNAQDTMQPTLAYIGGTGRATVEVTESYPALDGVYQADRPTFNQAYDNVNRSVANDLREVAKIIWGQVRPVPLPAVAARFFQISNGGYDTHSDQGGANVDGQHFSLHNEIAQSVQVFYEDLADMGIADKVCILVYSEFSRRIEQNDSGTDHGSQGPVIVIGGGVNGGVYGNHPNIAAAALDTEGNTIYSQNNADPFRSTDIRDVYGTVLKHWFNMSQVDILSGVLPVDVLGDPNLRWMSPNFDLGFV